jgi:CHASE2 domain-containing sensor protein
VQSALLFLVGMVVLVFHGLTFDLTPWSQVMMNHIVDSIYPDSGQNDTTVVLFQEKNLRELKAGYPVSYTLQAEVFEAIASYGPRAVFIDFVFMDRGDTEHLLKSMCKLYAVVEGRLFMAAPLDDDKLASMQKMFRGCARLVTALMDPDTGVSGVLTYCTGTWGLRGCEEGLDRRETFMDSPAVAMARHHVVGIAPEGAERMEILWPSTPSELNRRWMKCDPEQPGVRRLLTRLKHGPLEVKEECAYTNTVSVAHLLGTFDPDVERVIRGKAVFYGASFDASGDRVVSPTYHDLPGVYLHAMAYDNLVSLGGSYKRADRAAWAWPSWRSAVADIGLLAALVMLWVAAGYASWSRALEAPVTPEESRGLPKAFVDRVAWTMVLVAGVGALIGSGLLSEAAVLWTVVAGYWGYKVLIRQDGLFLVASVLVAVAAIVSFRVLNLGPRNVVGYLVFFELARHVTAHLDEAARTYVRFRETVTSDRAWGKWARWKWPLDLAIGVWLRGKVEGGEHGYVRGAHSQDSHDLGHRDRRLHGIGGVSGRTPDH